MKSLRDARRVEAFNLIELLAVVAIVGLIVATFLQPKPKRVNPPPGMPNRENRYRCMNNQREIAVGLLTWANDHDGKFPWQTATNGTEGSIANGRVSSQFQALSSYVRDVTVFVCPRDRVRQAAVGYKTLANTNISYFVNVDAATNSGDTILLGDRHLQSGDTPVGPGLFVYTNGMAMGWTRELHGDSPYSPIGMVTFADGHVERFSTNSISLAEGFGRQKVGSERLLVP